MTDSVGIAVVGTGDWGASLARRCGDLAALPDVQGVVGSRGGSPTVRSGRLLVARTSLQEPLPPECRRSVGCGGDRRSPLADGVGGLPVVRALAAARASLDLGGTPARLAPAGQEAS